MNLRDCQEAYDARLPPSFFDDLEDDTGYCIEEALCLLKNAAALLESGDRDGARVLMTDARVFLEDA